MWLLLFLFFISFRINSIGAPLERDQGAYGYVAQQIVNGQVLYKDVFDHKPPVIYYFYILANWISKNPYNTIPLGIIFATLSFLSMVLTGLISKKLFDKESMFIAMFLFNAFFVHPILTPFYANTEIPMLTGLTICLFIYVYFKNSKHIFAKWFIYGFFVSFTLLSKQIALSPLVILTLIWFYQEFRANKTVLSPILYFTIGNLASSALILLPVIIQDKGASFYETLIFNLHYLKNFPTQNAVLISISLFINWFATTSLIAWGMFAKHKQNKTLWALLLFTLAWLYLINAPYGHYFIIIIPIISLITTGLILEVVKKIEEIDKFGKLFANVFVVFSILLTCLPGISFLYLNATNDINYFHYRNKIFSQSPIVAKEIEKITSKEDYVFVTGMQPEINYYSRRKSPSRFFYDFPYVLEHPLRLDYEIQTIKALEKNKPKIIVHAGYSANIKKEEHVSKILISYIENEIANNYTEIN
ncbi:MAG: hypothetical protein NZM26_04435, partial [Patescibacteria group bacterium]|nr:hypothetical protein [Patescibacteria group bacterium]